MNIPGNIITLIAGIALTLISLWYGQNHGLMPIEASQGAQDVDELFNLMMTIGTGLFLIVEGVIVYCMIKFRRKKRRSNRWARHRRKCTPRDCLDCYSYGNCLYFGII